MTLRAYVICTNPRSGSTLLCDLLTETGVAGRPHSYFRAEDTAYWTRQWALEGSTAVAEPAFNRAYLSAMATAGRADTGVFGLRLMWRSVAETTMRLNAAFGGEADVADRLAQAFGPMLFIHLSRRDKLAQAVSLTRAEQTGLWHVAADGTERERTAPAKPPQFDGPYITRLRDQLVRDDAAWVAFFEQRGIEPLRVAYEDLSADPPSTLACILTALGVDKSKARPVSVRTAKMADTTTVEWLGRLK